MKYLENTSLKNDYKASFLFPKMEENREISLFSKFGKKIGNFSYLRNLQKIGYSPIFAKIGKKAFNKGF